MPKRNAKIVFLDRDGVINEFPGNGNYVTKVKDFLFVPGSLKAIRRLTEDGYSIFVVSNQAGVGKGIYSQNKLTRINRFMLKGVSREKGKIKKVFYCTHRSNDGCGCRKPGIGSIRKAFQIMKTSMREAPGSFFVGDTESDILAGRNAGCQTIFVLSGRETRQSIRKWPVKPDYIAKNLWEATNIITYENSHRPRLSRSRSH